MKKHTIASYHYSSPMNRIKLLLAFCMLILFPSKRINAQEQISSAEDSTKTKTAKHSLWATAATGYAGRHSIGLTYQFKRESFSLLFFGAKSSLEPFTPYANFVYHHDFVRRSGFMASLFALYHFEKKSYNVLYYPSGEVGTVPYYVHHFAAGPSLGYALKDILKVRAMAGYAVWNMGQQAGMTLEVMASVRIR
jgi:hypothetical protein